MDLRICLEITPARLNREPAPDDLAFSIFPIAAAPGTGMLTRFPSTTPFGLALGTDSPCAD